MKETNFKLDFFNEHSRLGVTTLNLGVTTFTESKGKIQNIVSRETKGLMIPRCLDTPQ